jgi:hypothetical protein
MLQVQSLALPAPHFAAHHSAAVAKAFSYMWEWKKKKRLSIRPATRSNPATNTLQQVVRMP